MRALPKGNGIMTKQTYYAIYHFRMNGAVAVCDAVASDSVCVSECECRVFTRAQNAFLKTSDTLSKSSDSI